MLCSDTMHYYRESHIEMTVPHKGKGVVNMNNCKVTTLDNRENPREGIRLPAKDASFVLIDGVRANNEQSHLRRFFTFVTVLLA